MAYNLKGTGDSVLGSIYLLSEGTDQMADGGFPEVVVEESGKGSTALDKSVGTHFLDVNSADFTGWNVTIDGKK